MGRRSWWIARCKSGEESLENTKKDAEEVIWVGFAEHSPDEVVHVREVLPGDVVLSADEFEKIKFHLNRPFEENINTAKLILDRAVKGDALTPADKILATFDKAGKE